MDCWLAYAFQRSDRSSHRHYHVGVPSSRMQGPFPIHVFVIEVAGHQDPQSSAERAVRSPPISGRDGENYAERIFTGLLANMT